MNTLEIHSLEWPAFMSVVTVESLRGKWLTASCLREKLVEAATAPRMESAGRMCDTSEEGLEQ
jgi:hypothetical protein